MHLGAGAGFKLGESDVQTFDFAFGGYGNDFINNFMPFYGYDFVSIVDNSFLKATIGFDWEFAEKNHFNFYGNFANIGDEIFEVGDWLKSPEYTGYAIGYGLETFLGPIEIKYSWSPEASNNNVFFNLGFWF